MATRILGLFGDAAAAEKAVKALADAGFDGARIEQGQAPAPESMAGEPDVPGGAEPGPGGPPVVNRAGRTAPTGAVPALADHGLAPAELSFFERSIIEGGVLVLLETDDPTEARRVMEEAGAQRTVT